MVQRVVTTLLILLALAGAVAGYQASANSAGPLAVLSDDDERCDDDNSGPGGSNGSGGDECDEDDDSGRGRGRGRGRSGDDDDEAVPPAAGADAADELVARIVDRGFSPANITVSAGQSVTFVNEDDDEHTATGDAFDTGTIPPGGSATVTFEAVGAFDFICIFHPEMQGTVTVAGEAAATPAAPPAASPAASPAADASTVRIVDFAFDPATLEIPAGTTVTWTNGDVAPHTATADDGSFDTGRLNDGERGSVTFDDPGAFAYHCDFHPDMVGEVVVR